MLNPKKFIRMVKDRNGKVSYAKYYVSYHAKNYIAHGRKTYKWDTMRRNPNTKKYLDKNYK